MSKTVLANVDGFTPCIDDITQKYGIVTSAVFGRMWRFCQGSNGICNASQAKIAKYLNVSRQTVLTHIKILVKDGYLEDRTPNKKNKPHTYADTGKASLLISLTASVNEVDSDGKLDVPEDSSKKPIKKQKEEDAKPTRPPAVDVYRSKARRYPDKATWKKIHDTVGSGDDDLSFWGEVVEGYILCGWNKLNINAMMDWYKRRKIPTTGNGATHAHATNGTTKRDDDHARRIEKAIASRSF